MLLDNPPSRAFHVSLLARVGLGWMEMAGWDREGHSDCSSSSLQPRCGSGKLHVKVPTVFSLEGISKKG